MPDTTPVTPDSTTPTNRKQRKPPGTHRQQVTVTLAPECAEALRVISKTADLPASRIMDALIRQHLVPMATCVTDPEVAR